MLYPAGWPYIGIVGAYYAQPLGPRCYVLVLFPECAWHSDLVEGVDHPSANYPIRC